MTKIERNGFRRILENKEAELEKGTRSREALAIDTSPDELDRIQNSQDRDFAIGVLNRGSTQLNEVRAALERVEADAFGVCSNCDQDISKKRIAAVPWAKLCIVCQEATERMGGEPSDEAEIPFANAA